jgi:hypothetical protein
MSPHNHEKSKSYEHGTGHGHVILYLIPMTGWRPRTMKIPPRPFSKGRLGEFWGHFLIYSDAHL